MRAPSGLSLVLVAFLAGCGGPSGPAPLPDPEETAHARGPLGIEAIVHLAYVGDEVRLWGTAWNNGSAELKTSGRCGVPAWTHGLEPGRLQYGWLFYEAVIQCLDSAAFPPGGTRSFDETWNGTYVRDGGWHQVPAGSYIWIAHLEVYDCELGEPGCGPRVTELRMPVQVS